MRAAPVLALALLLASCTTVHTVRGGAPGERVVAYAVPVEAGARSVARALATYPGTSQIRAVRGTVRFGFEGFDGTIRLRCVRHRDGGPAGWWPAAELTGRTRLLGLGRTMRLLRFAGALQALTGHALGELPGSRFPVRDPVVVAPSLCP